MLSLDKDLKRDSEPNSARASSGRVRAALMLFTSLLSACVPEGELNIGGDDNVAASVRDDTGDDDVQQRDSGDDSGEEDTDDTSDTGDSATDTSGEIEEPECEPNNTGAWPTAMSDEWGASFRENGGGELSGITGIPSATVGLPAEVIYGGGDNGVLYEMDGDFTFLRAWNLSTSEDIEGIGVDPVTGEFFTIDEDYSDVDGWNWASGTDPVKTATDCTLNVPADTSNNLGIEGFTYLSADEAPASWATESWKDERGYLLAGSQTDPNVGVFPIGLCVSDAVLTPVLSIPTGDSNTDIAGLSTLQGNLYVLKDGANTVSVIDLSTLATTYTYTLPTAGQEEGIWLKLDDCDAENGVASMYVADDVSGEINRYVVPVDSAY